jgi:hypothetical protein
MLRAIVAPPTARANFSPDGGPRWPTVQTAARAHDALPARRVTCGGGRQLRPALRLATRRSVSNPMPISPAISAQLAPSPRQDCANSMIRALRSGE